MAANARNRPAKVSPLTGTRHHRDNHDHHTSPWWHGRLLWPYPSAEGGTYWLHHMPSTQLRHLMNHPVLMYGFFATTDVPPNFADEGRLGSS